mmetsp:Transcript_62836/g.101650  ORF Transcript_62836/g.101650 Transcript_62836/m.101650 type:complete len:86 (-) Transcript_62836:41-298(-)
MRCSTLQHTATHSRVLHCVAQGVAHRPPQMSPMMLAQCVVSQREWIYCKSSLSGYRTRSDGGEVCGIPRVAQCVVSQGEWIYCES